MLNKSILTGFPTPMVVGMPTLQSPVLVSKKICQFWLLLNPPELPAACADELAPAAIVL